jgi:hypothetical protein
MGSFWGEKLGTAPPPPPRQVFNPNYVPRGMGSDDQSMQRAVNDYVSRLPGQQMNPQPPPPAAMQGAQWQANSTNPTHVSDVLPIWQWQGKEGAAETARIGVCPHCGSTNYFSRSSGTVINTNSGTSAAPAPECFECGYPRTQGVLGSAHIEGPSLAARQGSSPSAPMGSIARLSQA